MIASESLPQSGYGSYRWFEAVFNHTTEFKKVFGILSDNFGAIPALQYLERQVLSFVTEWGAGQEALTIQPPTDYTINRDSQGILQVFASSHPEIGEQLEGYLQFDAMPPAIRQGLQQSFSQLFDLEPNECLVIFSPTEFYNESRSDVNNLITVTEKTADGTIRAKGWFLFPNRQLSTEERKYWLQLHTVDPINDFHLEPRNLVKQPHLWLSQSTEADPDKPDENRVVKEYIASINEAFNSFFGYSLYKKDLDQESELQQELHQRVKRHISQIYDSLLHSPAIQFYHQLWKILDGGQRLWAELNDLNVVDYMAMLYAGQIQVHGFHPADGSDLTLFWDPLTNDWIGGTHDCSKETTKHCDLHGDYTGSECPDCKKHN